MSPRAEVGGAAVGDGGLARETKEATAKSLLLHHFSKNDATPRELGRTVQDEATAAERGGEGATWCFPHGF
ncbi:hypothetical protein MRX96_055705 [Rhipicephalus microplus]